MDQFSRLERRKVSLMGVVGVGRVSKVYWTAVGCGNEGWLVALPDCVCCSLAEKASYMGSMLQQFRNM